MKNIIHFLFIGGLIALFGGSAFWWATSSKSLSSKPLAKTEQPTTPTIAPLPTQSIDWEVEERPTIEQTQNYVAATCADTAGTSTRLHNGMPGSLIDTLCFGDTYTITHNGDGDFSGDGDPTTQGGIDIAIFTSPPTVSGCLVSDIQQPGFSFIGDLVGVNPRGSGNVTFSNVGTYQTVYNAGNPVQLWFANITVDDVNNLPDQLISEDVGGANECVNVSTSDAFSLVLLNDIDTTDFRTPAGGNVCQATIKVIGGLPQFNPSERYTISLELSTDPTVTGNITTSNHGHNSTVVLTVPESGIYNLMVNDGTGCGKVIPLDMTACINCDDETAGTSTQTLGSTAASSSPVYLCAGDSLLINHNGDQNTTGDPDGTTTPGVQYALYQCRPTVTGQTLDDIAADPCAISVMIGSQPQPRIVPPNHVTSDGNGYIYHSGVGGFYHTILTGVGLSITDTLWVVPITVDGYNNANSTVAWEGVDGPNECTRVSVADAFPMVFLNDITINAASINNSAGGNLCQGSFIATGGLPEDDNSNYNVTITLNGNPAVTGTVVTPNTHNGTIVFEVTEPGNYTVLVQDDIGCSSTSFTIDMTGCPTPCLDDAGSANLTLASTASSISTTSLCFGDSLIITHNNDATVSGDPNPATTPGVQYALYQCRPTVAGTTLNDIATDPCAITITVGSQTQPRLVPTNFIDQDGDGIIINNGSYQSILTGLGLNATDTLWIVPVTVDGYNAVNSTVTWESVNTPFECTNVSIAGAFPLTFLNDIQAGSINTTVGGNLCQGSFTVSGGSPEDDGSNYNITITQNGNPSVTGTVITPNTHNGTIVFEVPEQGNYTVLVQDNTGCASTSFTVDMTSCPPPCVDDAGTANIALAPTATNSTITSLCFGDSLIITHNGNANVSSDPNPATTPGIRYALYTCPPTVSGTTLNDIITNDPCVISQMVNAQLEPVLIPANLIDQDGNGTIVNNTSYQSFLAGLGVNTADTLWIVPITVDAVNSTVAWESVNTPFECTNVGIAGAVPLVFFDDLQVTGISNTVGGNDCQGAFTVTGGLPEMDGSTYNISVALVSDPTITGTIITPGTHNTTVVFDVPQPGLYQVTVQDNSGCNITNFNVDMRGCSLPCPNFTWMAGITSDYNGAAISCNGVSDGIITITPSGGALPYTYTWSHDNTLTDSIAMGLSANSYSVTVVDVNNCMLDTTINLTEPSSLFVGVTGTNPLCFGDSTGSVFVNNSGGGTPPYTFSWSTGLTDTSNNIIGLPSGSYQVTMTDANGCTATAATTLGDPPALGGAFTTINHTTCIDVADGSATITPSGGTPPYTYSWQHNLTLNSPIATNLGVGRYYVGVLDANGCAYGDSVDILPTLTITATLDSIDVSCYEGSDGTVTVTPMTTGGPSNLPYSYIWSSNANTPDTSNMATGLVTGVYSVTVEDNAGCVYEDSITVNQPDSITFNVLNTVDILCNGDATGSIAVMASGGTPAYSYLWDTGDADSLLNDVTAGTYKVSVTDDNGCVDSLEATIVEPPILVVDTVITTPVSCNGATDGAFSIFISGGTGVYQYVWSRDPAIDTLATISNLGAGQYFITVTDENGCSLVDTLDLTEPDALVANAGGTDMSCFNVVDGTAFAMPTGGTMPYTYLWNTGLTTDTITGLADATYYVTVTDASGCTATDSVIVNIPSVITSTITTDTVSCFGGVDGEVTVTSTGGQGSFSYLWSNGQVGPTATQLGAGIYFVTITDLNGCSIMDTTTVEPNTPISPIIQATPVSCLGGNDGSIEVSTVIGGTPPFTYEWNTTPTQDSTTAVNLTAGVYQLNITDANGCTFGPVNITVNEPTTTVTATASSVSPVCNGETNGSVTVVADGGTPSYTYLWSDGQTTPTAINVGTGNYMVTVTDASGCTATATSNVTQPDAVIATLNSTSATCNGSKDGRIALDTVTGGIEPYAYSLDGSNYQPTDIIFFGLLGGNYDVFVRDANGCIYEETVLVEEPQQLVVDLGPDITLELGDNTTLEALTNTTNPVSYAWTSEPTDSVSMSCMNCQNPTIAPIKTTTYTVTVQDSSGCSATDFIEVAIDKNRNVFIPNAFTPNGDGRNDKFMIFGGVGVVNINRFAVYDRWGELLYSATNISPNSNRGWDGRFRGILMPPGVYVYFAEIEFSDGLVFPYKGDITLLR